LQMGVGRYVGLENSIKTASLSKNLPLTPAPSGFLSFDF